MNPELNKEETIKKIDEVVKENDVVIFMKGTPSFPQCGYSSRASAALKSTGVSFTAVNVLESMAVFNFLPAYADWPTFPQIYIKGELIGGHDIIMAQTESGDLKKLLEEKNIPLETN